MWNRVFGAKKYPFAKIGNTEKGNGAKKYQLAKVGNVEQGGWS